MDRRIDERFRKPRRTKGTPFFIQRNYWAAGVILLGGCSWFLLDASKIPASSVESLSNYFIKKTPQSDMPLTIHQSPTETIEEPSDDNIVQLDSESPYKNLNKIGRKVILNDSASDAADFRSPVPTTRKPKNRSQKSKSKTKAPVKKDQSKRGRPKSTDKSPITKIITDNFKYFGDNPEHMQIAMALSKSSYEAECSSSSKSPCKEDESNIICDIRRNTKPAFLELFGFTSRKKVLSVESRRLKPISSESTKRNKNRFKYITPILSIRTNEERSALIDSKISLILSQNNPQPRQLYEHTINSNKLTNWISRAQSVFNLNEIYQKNVFYVKGLPIPQHTYKCGCLLKDWNLIPGRDKSPCKRKQDDPVEKNPADCKDLGVESAVRNLVGTSVQTKSSENSSQNQPISEDGSPCEMLLAKHPDEMVSLGSSCPNLLTKSKEPVLAFSNKKIDATPGTSLAKSTIQSFSSSCRSMSPDLFGSDDEIDQHYLSKDTNNVVKSSISTQMDVETTKTYSLDNSIAAEIGLHDSLENCVKGQEHSLKSSDKTCENDPGSEKSCSESTLPNDIIDLTCNDDNERLNNLSHDDCSSDIAIITDDSDTCDSPHTKNDPKKRFSTPTENIYNLEDFENDDHNKMDASPEVTEQFRESASDHDNKYIDNLNNEIGDSHSTKTKTNDFFNQKDKQENPIIAANTKRQQIVDEIIIDNETNSFVINTGSKTENYVDTYLIEDSLPDSQSLNDFNEKQINAKQDIISPNNTPQRDQGYKGPFSPCDAKENYCETANDEAIFIHNTSIENSSLEATPNRYVERSGIKSPCFDEPILYDSTDLNVTDYVYNMLKQDNISLGQTQHMNADELGDVVVVNSDEEVPLSQDSQGSVILDEELNYSSHYATPAKGNIEARNKRKYSYDNEIDHLDDVVPLSPEVEEPICLGTPLSKKASVIELNNMPKITIAEETPTTDNIIIKTVNVTPMPEYDNMTTPLINKELQKVGVKPLKRTRGAKLLKYIYESTHPFVGNVPDNSDSDEDKRVVKRRKKSKEGHNNLELNFSNQNKPIPSNSVYESLTEIIGDRIIANEKLEDLIFERKRLTKIASCKVPLQIVWHNLVSSDQAIKEKILLYEPLELESLHMMLKKQGFKFHMQDLLTFLDKKCITIRTAQKRGK